MSRPPLDLETGMPERSVNIEDILEAKNIPAWGKPRGVDLFERNHPLVNYVERQRSQ